MTIGVWQDKIWGKTKLLECDASYSKHELLLISDTYCSLHYHKHRSNLFHVIAGLIEIIVIEQCSIKRLMLYPNYKYTVLSKVPHMFVVHNGGMMIEEYFADQDYQIDSEDIYRYFEGGKVIASDRDSITDKIKDIKCLEIK